MSYERDNEGTLNINDRKTSDRAPDWRGSLTVDGVEYWISGWDRSGRNGEFISLSVQPKESRQGSGRDDGYDRGGRDDRRGPSRGGYGDRHDGRRGYSSGRDDRGPPSRDARPAQRERSRFDDDRGPSRRNDFGPPAGRFPEDEPARNYSPRDLGDDNGQTNDDIPF